MQQRKKANDLFLESKPIFGEKMSFCFQFPEIQEIKGEITESGYGIKKAKTHYIITDNDVGEYINCGNPCCYGGGFPLGKILREMYKNRQEYTEGMGECIGYEGSLHGKKNYRTCINEFNYRIIIKYIST